VCGGEILSQLRDFVAVAALQRGDLQGERADDRARGVGVDSRDWERCAPVLLAEVRDSSPELGVAVEEGGGAWGVLGDGFEGDRAALFDQLADGPLGALDGVLVLACRGCA
jgi:hypothetical protein